METITYHGEQLTIYRMNNEERTPVVKETCSRCGGTGHFSFNPQDGTRCFGCHGSGTQLTKVSTIENRIAKERQEQAQRDRNGGLTNREAKAKAEIVAKITAERDRNNGLTDSEVFEQVEFCRERQEQAKRDVSQHIGNVGEKLEGWFHLHFVKWIDTRYGQSLLIIAKDNDGNVIKSFSSGKAASAINERWVTDKRERTFIAGTVKAHEEWKGERNTMLTRIKTV